MSAQNELLAAYERTPYVSVLQAQSHPANLATLAFLHGIDAASPERCRVLELGCADGGNLLPMAASLPHSTFLGIDLVPSQIEEGAARVRELGLANLELRAMSILDVDATLGEFDFIICHGVYSWVGADVQQRILDICATRLAPHGVAYVSYNTLPGWYMKQMIRDAAQFHARTAAGDDDRVRSAAELLQFLTDATAAAGQHPYAMQLRIARQQFESPGGASWFVHEFLEPVNEPVYFHEFAARAAAHGLAFVCEADPDSGDADHQPPHVAAALERFAGDRIAAEQYVDFIGNRTFRRTLLSRAPASRRVSLDRIAQTFVASSAKPVSADAYRTDRGRTFTSTHPAARAALAALAVAWPESLAFADLQAQLGGEPALAEMLEALFAIGAVELDVAPPHVTRTVSARPVASPIARWEAARGAFVTTQRNRVITADASLRRLLPQLDGTRGRHSFDAAQLARAAELALLIA